jgi:transposase-like protein
MASKPVAREKIEAVGIDAIEVKIEGGASISQVAREIGVGFGTLYEWLHADSDRSARVRAAVVRGAEADDDKALDALTAAERDPVEMTRAREIAQHYRWRAKIKNPDRYGEKSKIEVTHRYADMDDSDLDAEIAAMVGLPLDRPH